MTASPTQALSAPITERVRHALHRRSLTVISRETLTPHMLRLTLQSDDLESFASASPDDHVKLFFETSEGEKAMRDYTPRAFDTKARTLTLDFALHDAGPATAWALDAQVGDLLNIAGPRGSRVLKGISKWLLIGDETALPAMGRRIEEMDAASQVTALIAVPGPEDEQVFDSAAEQDIRYVHRPVAQADDATALLEALKSARFTADTFVWIAAEAMVSRALRDAVLATGHPKVWTKTAGYWTKGFADKTEKFDD